MFLRDEPCPANRLHILQPAYDPIFELCRQAAEAATLDRIARRGDVPVRRCAESAASRPSGRADETPAGSSRTAARR